MGGVPCIPDTNRGLDVHSRDCVIITKLLHPPEQGRRDLSCTGSTRDSKTVLLVLVIIFLGGKKNRFVGHFPPQNIFQPPPFRAGCQPCVLPSTIWIPPQTRLFLRKKPTKVGNKVLNATRRKGCLCSRHSPPHSWAQLALGGTLQKNREPRKKKKIQQRRQPAPATLVIPGGAGSRQWEIQGQAVRANKPRTVRRRRR